uniref:Putative secreted protein n=1 Tax=Ixodes ricinus TaxID=34613 RepID=A0A6B0UI69_IXORI
MFGLPCLQSLLVTWLHFLLATPVYRSCRQSVFVVSGRTVCCTSARRHEKDILLFRLTYGIVSPVRCLWCIWGRRWSTVGIVDLLKATRWLLVERRQRT